MRPPPAPTGHRSVVGRLRVEGSADSQAQSDGPQDLGSVGDVVRNRVVRRPIEVADELAVLEAHACTTSSATSALCDARARHAIQARVSLRPSAVSGIHGCHPLER